MIKFYDSNGTVHFGQATITRKTSVNGGLSLTGEVFAGDAVLNGLDYGWWLNFDNEKYVITYKKLSDDTDTVVFDAVQQFFWDFAKVALHTQYTGSHKYSFYLGKLFDKSGYTYKNDATVPAFEKENWGYKNKLDLFNDIMDQANVEFEVHNETVHIAKQLGSDLTNFVRKGINLSDLTEEMKISDFATYARGYGAFKDDQDKSKGRLEVEYHSELAKKFGDLEMDPIVDERYAVADNLIAALKKQVDATYTVSMTMNIYDLENAGYPNYKAPKVGDWILAIDEALNFKRKIRIIKLEEQFDVTGKRIGYTATCGDLNIVDQYTKLQVSLDSKVQRIQKSVDAAATSANGKSTNYYGAKEPASANKGDLWFDQSNDDPDKWSIKQRLNGRWEQITLNPGEISDKVDVAKKEAETATENAKQLAAKYDDTNALANQAIDNAMSAQSDANSAIAKAESTASEFGKVSQKTDSAVAAALNAQSDANTALDNAKTAKDVADSTKVDATQAKSDSATALDNAKTALTNAKDAQTNANTALDNAKTAQDSADSIKVDVDDVKGTLDSKADKTSVDAVTKRVTTNATNITQNAKDITTKANQTDVDAATKRVSTAETNITQNANSIKSKASQSDVTALTGRVSTAETNITQNAKDITSKASQTDVDTLTGRVKDDESEITQNAKDITSKVSSSDVQGMLDDGGYATQSWTGSQIDQKADEISSTVASVSNKVDNMQVGGTNLLADTSDTWNSGTASGWGNLSFRVVNMTEPGMYTGNVYLKPDKKPVNILIQVTDSDGTYHNHFGSTVAGGNEGYSTLTVKVAKGQTLKKVWITFSHSQNDATSVSWKKMKLEKGNIATDWSPAPEDMATVTAVSKLSQTVDGIKTDVSKKIEQKDLNGYATETWTQNKINATADGIKGTISSVKGTVDGHDTSINDLKADSSSFKAQFTTVNDTLGKQSTDIGTLQSSSKELSSNFSSLNTDNNTNKNDISELKQTADGLKSDISKKIEEKDLNGYATQTWAQNKINATADGINATVSSVKHTVDGHETSINDLKADSNDFKSQFTKVNDTLGEQTTDIGTLQASSKYLSANFDSLSSDNQTNQHNISQLQASATKFNSTLMTVQQRVTDSAVGTNLLLKTGTPFSMTGNNTSNQVGSAYSLANRYNVSSLASALGTQFTISYDWSVSGDSPSGTFATQWNNVPWGIDLAVTVSSSNASGHVSHTFSVSTDSKNVGNGLDIRLDNFVGSITISNVKLEKGSLATDWCPNPADNATVTALSSISQTIDSIQTTVRGKVDNETYQSKINQLSDQINLRVESKGVINAVNVSKEGTSIYGNKLHITADTYIDNAVIKDAMIESIKADKIYTGTLDAANVNVIHLNAGNITTGTIKGANLSINLTTGEILFQKGTIKSTNGNLNIDIDSGKMAVVNSSGNGFRFENGKLYLTSNTWVGWGQSKPDYGSITYEPNFLSNVKGMKISGSEGIAVTTGNYDTYSGLLQHQPDSGAALSLRNNTALLNAREMTRIEGGNMYSISTIKDVDRATIIVGGANGGSDHGAATNKYGGYYSQWPIDPGTDIYMRGNKITLQGGSNGSGRSDEIADLNFASDGKARIFSAAIYNRTYSSGNKVAITSYGTLGRITSARKYKIADTPALNVISKAKRVLDIKPAEWYDKAEIESIADAKTNGTEAPGEAKIEKHYGFIADDFDAAGLTEVVLYKDGEVDSLDYDRISIYHNVILTDHEKRIAELEEEIKQLKGEI